MRPLVAACLCAVLAACASASRHEPRVDHRVLFVGNSLTYYNDLPRIVQAMYSAAAPGHAIEVDMLASGGAKIADHLHEGPMAALLKERRYDVVVLQDLGGFPACGEDFPGCGEAVASVCAATRLVRDAGARPILFGTWQAIAGAQSELSAATREEAQRCGLEMADVGAAMQRFRHKTEVSPWQEDGHPELAGSWLAGAVLTRAIAGQDVSVDRPIEPFCRRRWQGAHLELGQLASQEIQPEDDCAMPPQKVAQAAIRAANVKTDDGIGDRGPNAGRKT